MKVPVDQWTDEELVSLVLGTRESSAPGARARGGTLLDAVGGVGGLGHLGGAEARTLGISPRALGRLEAAVELGRRVVDRPVVQDAPIRRAEDVYVRLRARLGLAEREELHVLGLDTAHRVRTHFVVGMGGLNQVWVSPRDVFRPLVRAGALAAVVVHNHPSGEHDPSNADAELTARLAEAGELVGIRLLDHVIIARSGYFSFAESDRREIWRPDPRSIG